MHGTARLPKDCSPNQIFPQIPSSGKLMPYVSMMKEGGEGEGELLGVVYPLSAEAWSCHRARN